MIAADRSDSNSEIQRRQDVYYQFINKAFILKVIRNYWCPIKTFRGLSVLDKIDLNL